jgi:hypothetical protein
MLTKFSHKKNNCEHLSQKRVFTPFSKLYLVSKFWTFLKMSKFHFPFDFMGKSCDCDGESKTASIFCYLL